MYKRVIFGPVANTNVAELTDLTRREFWLLATVAIAVLAMGIWPKPFIDVMHTSVADLLVHVAKTKLVAAERAARLHAALLVPVLPEIVILTAASLILMVDLFVDDDRTAHQLLADPGSRC